MIDCKRYADEILNSIRGYGHLAVISIGNDPASQSYIKGKKKDCERVGFGFTHHAFNDGVDVAEVVGCINKLNNDPLITGIIIQLPLPKGYDEEALTNCVASEKDVDGFKADSPFKPCTPEGIVYLLRRELYGLEERHVTIIGRGKLVGKPLAKMLLDENMTVSICHSKTHPVDLDKLTRMADAVIVATGQPQKFRIPFDNCRPPGIVIDCGVHRVDGKLCGDVQSVFNGLVTPVPGGVGLLTRAMLMKHVERKEEG